MFPKIKSYLCSFFVKLKVTMDKMKCQSLYVVVFLILNFNLNNVFAKRGPHHPRSELSKSKTRVDQHLTHEEHHIGEDLEEKWGVDLDPNTMTEEEKHFYYFKVHDSDNNNALDGLEMLHAALHQDDRTVQLERDSYLQNASQELNHIIEVIDDFLNIADINRDGLLHYPEYMKAIIESREVGTNSEI